MAFANSESSKAENETFLFAVEQTFFIDISQHYYFSGFTQTNLEEQIKVVAGMHLKEFRIFQL